MNISCDESKKLRASRMRAEQNHLSKLKKFIKATVNPFSLKLNKDFLFNIKTGTQASKMSENIFSLYSNVERKKMNVAASLNLFNLFPRQPLLPLLAKMLEEKINQKRSELQATKSTKDLFGSLLTTFATNGMNLWSVFFFLILPESVRFAYSDGKIANNGNSFSPTK